MRADIVIVLKKNFLMSTADVAPLPLGALKSIAGAALSTPMFYLSAEQAESLKAHGLSELAPYLPCWVPQVLISDALFGAGAGAAAVALNAHRGAWCWATEFSNVHSTFFFKEAGFVLEGRRYSSLEAYFQLKKSEGCPDHEAAVAEMGASDDPALAFAVGRRHSLRPDWAEARAGVMRAGLEAKFTQDPRLSALLLETGAHALVQLKPDDEIWGTGAAGTGANALGTMLEELRARLRDAAGAGV